MSDSITSFIGLKDSDVDYCQEVIRRNDNTDHHLIYVRLVNHGGLCPQCGTFTKHIKEYCSKQINHAKFLIERCTIIYSARRFRCPKCGSTFFEDDPFQSQYRNISDTTVDNVLKLLNDSIIIVSAIVRHIWFVKERKHIPFSGIRC